MPPGRSSTPMTARYRVEILAIAFLQSFRERSVNDHVGSRADDRPMGRRRSHIDRRTQASPTCEYRQRLLRALPDLIGGAHPRCVLKNTATYTPK
jgi:hypothetical protein